MAGIRRKACCWAGVSGWRDMFSLYLTASGASSEKMTAEPFLVFNLILFLTDATLSPSEPRRLGIAMYITEAQKQQFQDKGFFVLENLFGTEELDALTGELDSFINEANENLKRQGGQGISRPDEIVFTAFIAEKNEKVKAFVKQDKFVQLTTALICPDVRLYWNQAVFKFPETQKEFPWHQDNGYTPLEPEQYYTCWLALTDATIENGCIWVLPESHKNGTQPHERTALGQVGYFGSEPGVPVPLRKGSVAVFSSLLFHRSGANQTQNEVRKAYIIQYIPAHARNARNNEPFTDRIWVAKDGQRYDG